MTPTGRLIQRRATVSRAGYRWAAVDDARKGDWIDRAFRITKQAARQAPQTPEREQSALRSGFYLCRQDQAEFDLCDEIDIDASAPALFRTFASLPLASEGIKDFADRWGLLGGALATTIEVPPSERLRTGPFSIVFEGGAQMPVNAEPADRWAAAILEMRSAVEFWDMIREGDEKLIAREIPHLWARHGRATQWMTDKMFTRPFQTGEGTLAAIINSNLERSMLPRLLPGESKPKEWKLVYEPASLLDTLWIQFALAVAGNIEHRQCAVCTTWFEVATGSNRADKLFCSDACRMRAYRKRKAERQ